MKRINEMSLDFPASPQNETLARLAISAFLLPLNPTLEQLADVKTSVSEAVTNAIIHGYRRRQGTVRMTAALLEDGTLEVDVIDWGIGIEDVLRARQPFFTTQGDEERSGMGFTVMESFMDSVKVCSAPGKGTVIHMAKRLGASEETGACRA